MSEEAPEVDLTADAPAPDITKPDDSPIDITTSEVDTRAKPDNGGASTDELSGDVEGGQSTPETLTYTPPEGIELTETDTALLSEFAERGKDIGLSQDQFQKIVELDIARSKELNDQAVEGWKEQVSAWKEASRTDKEIGGPEFNSNVEHARTAVKQFGDAELMSVLRDPSPDNPSGLALNNHPAFLRFFTRIGRVIADPTLIEGGDSPTQNESWRNMYPSMKDL